MQTPRQPYTLSPNSLSPNSLSPNSLSRRSFLKRSAASTLAVVGAATPTACVGAAPGKKRSGSPAVQTVLGPVAPDKLGATLTHEHAPVVDWSELYEAPTGPIAPRREEMLAESAKLLDAFHDTLDERDGPGAIVETTPIRVGRYPRLLVDLANRTKVHVIASSGFWCEALAPQHPWAVRLGIEKGGTRKMTELFVREVTEGMEDPSGKWGGAFTDIRAGVIKIATSTYLRPSERVVHIAAALASKETGCPITTHTTDGGGMEQAEVLLKNGASPTKVVIGHQGYRDDRENDEPDDYHLRLAGLGVSVQFDRVGHESYPPASQARQIKKLVDAGHVGQVLVSHDHVPYFYTDYTAAKKAADGWNATGSDFTVVTRQLVPELKKIGVADGDIRTILVENPGRVLAF